MKGSPIPKSTQIREEISARALAHAGLLLCFALLLALAAWAKILLNVVNCPSCHVYCETGTAPEIQWEETVNRYLQQQSQKDEVEGQTLVNQQHHSDSTRQVS